MRDTKEGRSLEAAAFRRQQEHLKCVELARENCRQMLYRNEENNEKKWEIVFL